MNKCLAYANSRDSKYGSPAAVKLYQLMIPEVSRPADPAGSENSSEKALVRL